MFVGAATYPYWGQMAYYVPQPMQTPATAMTATQNHPATPTIANPLNSHTSSTTDSNITHSWRKPDISRYATHSEAVYLF